MKTGLLYAAIIALAIIASFALVRTAPAGVDYAAMLADIGKKLDMIAEKQNQLDTIEKNQQRIIQMLRILRRSS